MSRALVAELDPLSRALAAAVNPTQRESRPDPTSSADSDTFEPWSSKRNLILNQYVTTKKISMTTAMNNTNDESPVDTSKSKTKRGDDSRPPRFVSVIDTTTTASERVKSRLEQLDAFEVRFDRSFISHTQILSLVQGGQQTQSLTQQEYINRINDMNKEMVQAWKNDQRVKTLKIAIQVGGICVSPSFTNALSLSVRQIAGRYECDGILSE